MSLNARTKELLERARRDAEPSADELRQVRARLAPRLATEEPALTAVPLAFLKVAAAVAVAAAGGGPGSGRAPTRWWRRRRRPSRPWRRSVRR
jgi:hypothetical protein